MPLQDVTTDSMELLIINKIHLSLTIMATVCYSIIFLTSYVQLWIILFLKYKLLSPQSIYFFLCCIFTSLRIVLFSFFYNDLGTVEKLNGFVYWMLMCLPMVFQYLIVLLITVFYYKAYNKSKFGSSRLTRNGRIVILLAILLDILVSIIPVFSRINSQIKMRKATKIVLTSTYVIITDLLFLATISTFVYVYKQFPKFPNAALIQEAKKITKTRSVIVSTACIFGVLAKCIYDTVAVVGGSHSVNFSLPSTLQQSDFVNTRQDIKTFVVFGIILLVWEVIPLVAVMTLFRVQLPGGFLKIRHSGHSSRSVQYSYSRSNSASLASNTATRSRFIAIPSYRSTNHSSNFSDNSSGYKSNLNDPAIIGDPSQLSGHSYDTASNYVRQHRSPSTYGSYTVQNHNRSKIYTKNSKVQKLIPKIWRSTSHKCLVKSHSKDHIYDPRVCSSRLPTANEE